MNGLVNVNEPIGRMPKSSFRIKLGSSLRKKNVETLWPNSMLCDSNPSEFNFH